MPRINGRLHNLYGLRTFRQRYRPLAIIRQTPSINTGRDLKELECSGFGRCGCLYEVFPDACNGRRNLSDPRRYVTPL